jgi:hypothetical protein
MALRVMIDMLYRGPTELVQHSAYRGIPIVARALLVFGMVWLYRSPKPVGWKGGLFLFHMKARRRGEESQHTYHT